MMPDALQEIAYDIDHKLKIDRRFVVAEARVLKKPAGIEFIGSSAYAARRAQEIFLSSAKRLKRRRARGGRASGFSFTVHLLPDAGVGEESVGFSKAASAPVMRRPLHASEIVTQVLLAESFDVLQRDANWIRVRLHSDGYVGWVSPAQVELCSPGELAAWERLPRAEVFENLLHVKKRPSPQSETVRDAVAGVRLPAGAGWDGWTEVLLPDGVRGWVPSDGIRLVRRRQYPVPTEAIVKTAKRFLGVPYLWGGRSSIGFDCSGFVQTVFRLNGVELPRDASLQWRVGKRVGRNPRSMQKGDLVFFHDERGAISHVGIAIGGRCVIHASGYVRVDSMDPRDPRYEERLRTMFAGARRLET